MKSVNLDRKEMREMKGEILIVKNSFYRLTNTLDRVKERIGELKNSSMGNIQIDAKRQKQSNKKFKGESEIKT
jgi:hypothetical protein